MTTDVLALADWLTAWGVTSVATEATGVYWKPSDNLLEQDLFEDVWVVNPQPIKGMKGRKTDGQDSQWIAQLLQVVALHPSYVHRLPQRELREIVRYRKSLI